MAITFSAGRTLNDMEQHFPFVNVSNPTWLVYVAVLVIAVFFRFSRLFTVRNLDVLLILLLSTSLVVASASKGSSLADPGAEVRQKQEARNRALFAVAPLLPDGSLDPGEVSRGIAANPGTTDDRGASAEVSGESLRSAPVGRWSSIGLLLFSLLLMVRLVFDESLTRRPRLEQNLNQAGLTFLCVPAFALLTISIFLVEPPQSNVAAVEHGRALLQRREVLVTTEPGGEQPPAPTETLLAAGAAGMAELSGRLHDGGVVTPAEAIDLEAVVAQILVAVSHTTVVLGLLYIGFRHFNSIQLGISMSCLYLLLPCTAFHVHHLSHVLPGACLTWAIAAYRRPVVSGVLLGLACGTLFFAVFLVPLWAVFYGRRGAFRFGTSLVAVGAVLAICLMLTSSDTNSFMNKLVTTMNWTVYRLLDGTGNAAGTPLGQLFVRIPMAAVFFVMLTAMTVLPRPRNLENLLANSAALVVAAQLWYPDDIGTYVLWYLPLFLLVVFRPRLDRFMPPDLSERRTAVPQVYTGGAPSPVAMSRLTLYQ